MSRLESSDFSKEVFQQSLELEKVTEETKKYFKMGMEAMLAVIRQVEIAEADKKIKKYYIPLNLFNTLSLIFR